ncbi:hypothetical protein LCGC14_0643660 [marine sediment metagenome]|uniref:Uncharacterized protein n=1 Tax=marine sediment metagenome TaxID=412755 RepID=A0A0F9QYI9_9ZZZZ|nr:hypothetical protein [Pricia sp.]
MRTQIHTIVAPRGGLNLGLPADRITDIELADAENVFFQDGFIKTRYGYSAFGTNLPLSGTLVQIDQFKDFNETTWVFALTDKNIYRWDSSNTKWNIWPGPNDSATAYGAGAYGENLYGGAGAGLYGAGLYGAGLYGQSNQFNGADNDFWSFDFIQDVAESQPWWVATNNTDPVIVFKGGSNTAWEELLNTIGGVPFRAKFLVEFKSHLVFLDTTEGGSRLPQKVRWSNTADPSNIDTGNASSNNLSGTDWISGAVKFRGDLLCIVKEDSVWICWATGDSDIFDFDRKISGQGSPSPRTIKVINGDVVFLGRDDVYIFDGVSLDPLGVASDDPQSTKIRRELVQQIAFAQITRAFAFVREQDKEYWIFVPTSGTYPDTAFIYNYELRSWSKFTFNDNITGHGFFQLDSSVAYDDLVGSFDAQTWRFGDRSLGASSPNLLLGDNVGNVFEYSSLITEEDGTVLNKQFDTKDFNFTRIGSAMRINRADISFTGSSLDLYYSIDKGSNWNLIKSFGSSSSLSRQQASFRTACDWIRFRCRVNAIGGNFQFNRINIFWQYAGRIGT